MALVSGRSTLNPNAPLFIPAALRQVESFSPEWWDLITTSTSFREYWMSKHDDVVFGNEDDDFDHVDVVGLLPDTFDLSAEDEFSGLEFQFEAFIQSSDRGGGNGSTYFADKRTPENGSELDVDVKVKTLILLKSPKERGAKAAFEP